jgi:hypothetical protein
MTTKEKILFVIPEGFYRESILSFRFLPPSQYLSYLSTWIPDKDTRGLTTKEKILFAIPECFYRELFLKKIVYS